MAQAVRDMLTALRGLGSVTDLRARANEGYGPEQTPLVNAHIHLPPNFSAFTSVKQAVDLAAAEGIGVLGSTNYYDYDVYGQFAARARDHGIFPLFGLEIISMDSALQEAGVLINDPGNPGKFYVCGKGATRFDPMSARAQQLLGRIRSGDAERMQEMVNRMERVFAERGLPTGLTSDSVIDMVVQRHGCDRAVVYLQERHLAQAFQQALFDTVEAPRRLDGLHRVLGTEAKATDPQDSVTIQNDIRTHLLKAGKPAYVEEAFLSFAEACELILELGGIPAYAAVVDGMSPLSAFERTPAELIANMQQRNLHFAEMITIRNAPDIVATYTKAFREAGIPVTAGTEHNTLDLIPIEPACKGGAKIPDDIREIFWEGACVVAAHQFLCLHGERGFVDGQGRAHPDYATADDRIRDFAALGAAVIRRYYDTCRVVEEISS